MCLLIPAKVIKVSKNFVEVEQFNKKRKVSSKLIKPKIGDYVLIKGNVVVDILDKKAAKDFLKEWKKII